MELSRISKLLIDRDDISADEVFSRREQYPIALVCGADVAQSYTLQLAVLTAAAIAGRCFPRAVSVSAPPSLLATRLLVWPDLNWTFEQALADILGSACLTEEVVTGGRGATIVFGNAKAPEKALRATFDGWVAKVGPVADVPRLAERQYCSLAGVLSAALAMSEVFLSFAGINIEAGRRPVALSLWRPDLEVSDADALGVPVEYLPKDLWLLGLGHLGNAYAWALATLPYANASEAEFSLFDFDKVIVENSETGLLFKSNDEGDYKTRVVAAWLATRQFKTKLVERRFDDQFRPQVNEALLALCGFDSNPARRALKTAEFARVVESGLGGTVSNFDTISLHTLPNPRPVEELWPDMTADDLTKAQAYREHVVRTNKAYAALGHDECGRIELAGKAVAVPFVGAVAATLVVAEVLRLLHGGMRLTGLKIRLGALRRTYCSAAGDYQAEDLSVLTYVNARSLEN